MFERFFLKFLPDCHLNEAGPYDRLGFARNRKRTGIGGVGGPGGGRLGAGDDLRRRPTCSADRQFQAARNRSLPILQMYSAAFPPVIGAIEGRCCPLSFSRPTKTQSGKRQTAK